MNSTIHESILTCLPCGLTVVDGEGRILSINPALEEMLGWRLTELRGQLLSSCLEQAISDPAQALGWTVALSQALALNQTSYLNLATPFRVRPDDVPRVSVTGVVAPWQDSSTGQSGGLVLFHDCTVQGDWQGAQARFLAVLAHELGTPLTNLAAAAELLAERLENDGGAVWRWLQVVQSEANHLRRLLAQFPISVSDRKGSTQPRRRLVTVRPVLRQVAQAFRARGLHCQLVVQAPPDLHFVWSDEERIGQVVSKLVDNAIRFAPPGSEIVLAVEERGEELVVCVRDRGPGVLEEEEGEIFVPWRRGSREEPAAEHQGLGLSMARTQVQSLGGRLWHERRPEGGASFCFSLPRARDLPDGEEENEEPWKPLS